jgi:pseudoazurin
MKFLITLFTVILMNPAFAADLKIEMLNKDANGNKMVFSQEVVKVDVGTTITWMPTSKGHNVEIVASPNNMKFRSKNSKEAQITFDSPGIYYYWCTPHKGMGMIGLVVVGGDTSNKDQIAEAKALGKSKKKLKKFLAELG